MSPSKSEFNLWTPIPWLVTLAVVLIVGAVFYLAGDDEAGEPPDAPKQGQDPVTRLHQFYGPLSPEEGDPGWNCLTQGGKSC